MKKINDDAHVHDCARVHGHDHDDGDVQLRVL